MLQDMGFYGYPYTWNNGRDEETSVQERLDSMFALEELLNIIPFIQVCHGSNFTSDHCALIIYLMMMSNEENRNGHGKMFRFEEAWCL